MLFGGRINRQQNDNNRKSLVRRLEKLKDFPIGTKIAYSFDKDTLLGTVQAHDLARGHLVIGRKRAHDPTEVVICEQK